ncbi:MAG TPA: acyl-CoA dehydrogenase family protein [Thermoanaerobaculia bacterium]|jgi:alkylation response protein AidB-like acyl-CoA dehydrogenase|nr:acyl-CoA dehydrogenase family protein [Thermoanaerobaculia bacterium]
MKLELTVVQRAARDEFRDFVAAEILPHADRWDREAAISRKVIEALRARDYLGSNVVGKFGGVGRDMITYGLLTEEIARGCSSVRSLLTVHDMVAHAIQRWGSPEQRQSFLPALARGKVLGALALSEPNAGSDAASVETTAADSNYGWVLNGHKKWTTFGQIAGLFLVLAKFEGQPTAFLVERETPGLTVKPLQGVWGTRASQLAELTFEECCIPHGNLIGRIGFGMSHVIAAALEHGRYSVAWGAVGIGQACLDACRSYTAERRQFGVPLSDHQLIRRLLADMIVNVRAARLLCLRAGWLRDQRDPVAFMEIMAAKYFASTMAVRAANDAVQIHGANGMSDDFPVGRYLRDAKVTEIIEGSTQIQQNALPMFDFEEF